MFQQYHHLEMTICLNPDCPHPENSDQTKYCQSCGVQMISLLRNRYRVQKVLSDEGGFGRTYLAKDVDKLNELCVVKQLAPKAQGTWAVQKAVELFEEEALRLQELGKHPQIPTLLAYFEQDHYMYLVQEFIDGQNLYEEFNQQGIYNEQKIKELLLDLLPILKYIHQHNVIHRDIKPQNIMRRQSDGKLILIDFGASKQLTASVRTKMGTTIGTPGYSPLEQMQDGIASPSSDLFSLGTTCFHLMTGILPGKLWAEHGYGWVKEWRIYLKHPISKELGDILDRLLKKDTEERYQSAEQAIAQLTPQQNIPSASKRNHKLLYPIVITSAIALLGIGGVFYMINSSQNPPTSSQTAPIKTLNGHSQVVSSIAMNPKGTTVVSGSYDTTVKLWNWKTGKETDTLQVNGGSIHAVAISNDGKILAVGTGNNTIKLWNLATLEEIGTFTGHTSAVKSLAISADGKTLASGSFDGNIKLWNVATQQETDTFIGHSDSVESLAFTSDGQSIVSGSADNTIKQWNLDTLKETRKLGGHFATVWSIAISPDDKTLASGDANGTVKLWNLNTGQEIHHLVGHSFSVNSVTFSPDGKSLASGSSDETIKLWNISNGELIRTLMGNSKEVTSVAFTPDGKSLASSNTDGIISIWQVTP
jgi:serine/threonine protein kinase